MSRDMRSNTYFIKFLLVVFQRVDAKEVNEIILFRLVQYFAIILFE